MYFILDNIFCFIDWYIEGDSTIDQRLALIDRPREAVLQQLKQVQDTFRYT